MFPVTVPLTGARQSDAFRPKQRLQVCKCCGAWQHRVSLTIVYILTGFGVLVALLTSVAEKYIELKREGDGARGRLAARRERKRPAEGDGPA